VSGRATRQQHDIGTQIGHDRAVVTFATVQMCALIYLQKFSIGGKLSVSMLIMLAGITWMVVSRNMRFVGPRLACYLVFVTCCLWSQSLVGGGSLLSFLELILLYGCMTVYTTVSETTYRQIVNRFIVLMILPACIIIVQYTYQRVTGLGDPISMTPLVPKSLVMQGYIYEAHDPWNSPFMRPNGFFFLEPSFVSAFTASAAILEIIYFRRLHCIVLMIVATIMSTGATGVSMLVIAAPFLLTRETPSVIMMATITAVVVFSAAYMLDASLPLLSRAGELQNAGSSGGFRVLLPADKLVTLVLDPSYSFIGDGAGAIMGGNPWPIVKIVNEYGLLAMISFVFLFTLGISGDFNLLPLKVALSIVFMFTGGYLLNPPMVELLVISCFMVGCKLGDPMPKRRLISTRLQ
jgi:hypothetical protein